MGLLYQLETELERETPERLRQSWQAALDVCQAQCPECQLAMHRHHAYRRSIMTGYGAVELRIPVFRCGECRRMSSGAEVLGEDERYRRYSKKRRVSHKAGGVGVELRGGQRLGGGGENQVVSLAEAGAVRAVAVGGPDIGNGWVVDAQAAGRVEMKVIRDEKGAAPVS